jgi:hypothetical protein
MPLLHCSPATHLRVHDGPLHPSQIPDRPARLCDKVGSSTTQAFSEQHLCERVTYHAIGCVFESSLPLAKTGHRSSCAGAGHFDDSESAFGCALQSL